MYSKFNHKAFCFFLLLASMGCKKEMNSQQENTAATPYLLQVPLGFPQPELSAVNPMTVEGVDLGKRLYADPILSTNGRSCTSCHQPAFSYSSPLFSFQTGLTLSVPAHINLGFKKTFNWDGSQGSLDTLAMGDFVPEIFNPDSLQLVQKIKAHPVYPSLFKTAFGMTDVQAITFTELKRKIAYSIAQYLRSRVSVNSKFDKYRRRELMLDPMEYQGYLIFFTEKGDCFHCHAEPLFTDLQFHNNGIGSGFVGSDLGRYNITSQSEDRGKFFSPTLRNIEITAPYMHDGRFKTLQEVVDFYSDGVKDSPTLDPLMTKRNGLRTLNLNPLEKAELIAFLKTLTDSTYFR